MSDERPAQVPFQRSPSDVAHDRIKGPYTNEDAIRPGPALGEYDEDGESDSALTEGTIAHGEGPEAQTHEEAVEAEENRRETFSGVELDEAEARDSLARDIAEASDEDIPLEPIPAVGSIPDHEDANAESGTVNPVTAGSESAAAVAAAKQDPEHNAEPVLGPDVNETGEDVAGAPKADDDENEEEGE